MPKKITQGVIRQIRELGEEVVKEGIRQPVEMLETAGKQIGMLPRGWGEKPELQVSTQIIQEKEKKRQEELAFWRGRQRELMTKSQRPRAEEAPAEEIERQRKLAEKEKEKKSLPKVSGKKPRGLLLGLERRKRESHPELVGRRVGG